MRKQLFILIALCILSCKKQNPNYNMTFLTENTPVDSPIEFMSHLIQNDKVIHKGSFNPRLNEYYYTISDKQFNQFDVYVVKKLNNKWSEPEKAFFNSSFSDHGMSFSPNGKSIYFSSTRPTNIDGVSDTWHIWESNETNGKWTEPVFIDIPNLKHKLVSHPNVTNSGTLYFHSSNLDFSEMDIYHSKIINNEITPAIKTSIQSNNPERQKCTPFVSPNEDYLLYASVGKQLDLMIAFNDGEGNWTNTRKLTDAIDNEGQGNPFITPDNKFLFFTTGKVNGENWKIKWVNIKNEIINN